MRARIYWAFLAVVLLIAAFVFGSPLVYTLLFALLAVPLIGFVASVFAIRRLSGEVRRVTSFLQVGHDLQEEIVVRNLHWFPKLLLEVEHHSTPFGNNGRVLTLWPYRTASWTSIKHCERRGMYTYGRLRVTSRDPLGLFNRTTEFGEEGWALIFPATVELPGFYVPAGHGWTEGLVRGKTFTPSAIASSVREYSPGDNMGHIHWPATAHRGKLMVKEYEREPSGPADAVWVMLDLDERVQAGEGVESTTEYCVTIAASAAKRFLDSGRTVGLFVNGKEESLVRPAVGMEQVGRVLQTLALAEPGQGDVMSAANRTISRISRGASVIIVSSASPEQVASAATAVEAAGAGVVPIIVEPASFRGEERKRGASYRLPGTNFDAYVVHMGDEIEQRLDYRIHGHAGMTEEMMGMEVVR